ncbi:hypothetical protein MKX01_011389 [Papaver californicum]|nr:hypothetical protein MKX01_011389 [Papaver californicum]
MPALCRVPKSTSPAPCRIPKSTTPNSFSVQDHQCKILVAPHPQEHNAKLLVASSKNNAISLLRSQKQNAKILAMFPEHSNFIVDYFTCVVLKFLIVEQCKKCVMGVMNWEYEDDTFYKLFRKSMRALGGLCMEFGTFFMNCQYHRLHINGIFPELEFKLKIDQDIVHPFKEINTINTPQYTREHINFKVMFEDKKKFMFTNLRSFRGKIVVVVGVGHMSGIELLWNLAGEDDNSNVC